MKDIESKDIMTFISVETCIYLLYRIICWKFGQFYGICFDFRQQEHKINIKVECYHF